MKSKILFLVLMIFPAFVFGADGEGRYQTNSNSNGVFVTDTKMGRIWVLQTGQEVMPKFIPIFFVLGNDTYSVYPSSYSTPVVHANH